MSTENEIETPTIIPSEADAQDALAREQAQEEQEADEAEVSPDDSKKPKRKKQAADAPYGRFFFLEPEKLVIVGLDTKLKEGEQHPLADPQRVNLPIEETFVEYMMMVGFDSVIAVRKNGDTFEVVKGRQRVKTAREANKRLKKAGKPTLRVKCEISRDDDETHFIKKFGENRHRIDDKPLETARNIRTFLDAGRSEEEAAIVFRMTKANITHLLKLFDLDPVIQRAVESGKVAASAVAPLAKLTREVQRSEFEKIQAQGGKVNIKRAKAAAKAKKKGADAEVIVPPGKRLVTKILDLNKEEGSNLDPMFVKGILWVLGDISTKGAGVKGLTALEHKAKAKKGESDKDAE